MAIERGICMKNLKETVKQMSKKTKIIILVGIIIILVIGICIGVGVHKRNEEIAREQGQAMFEEDKQKNQKAIDTYLYYAEHYIELAEEATTESSKESYKEDANQYLDQAEELATFMTEAQYNKWYSLIIRETSL